MWRANKVGICVLLAGMLGLGVAHVLLRGQDEQLAQQVLALGICVLLFGVALGTWISVRRDVARYKRSLDASAPPEDKEEP